MWSTFDGSQSVDKDLVIKYNTISPLNDAYNVKFHFKLSVMYTPNSFYVSISLILLSLNFYTIADLDFHI